MNPSAQAWTSSSYDFSSSSMDDFSSNDPWASFHSSNGGGWHSSKESIWGHSSSPTTSPTSSTLPPGLKVADSTSVSTATGGNLTLEPKRTTSCSLTEYLGGSKTTRIDSTIATPTSVTSTTTSSEAALQQLQAPNLLSYKNETKEPYSLVDSLQRLDLAVDSSESGNTSVLYADPPILPSKTDDSAWQYLQEATTTHLTEGQEEQVDVDYVFGASKKTSKPKSYPDDEWLTSQQRLKESTPLGSLPTTLNTLRILQAYAQREQPLRCEEWLDRIRDERNSGNSMALTTSHFSVCIQAWSKGPVQAEALLQRLYNAYTSGHTDLKPTATLFHAVISAWTASRERSAAVRAEQLLDWMTHLKLTPEPATFAKVMHAWTLTGSSQAAQKANVLLGRMTKLGLEPDTITYNVVINAWAKSGGAAQAEALLEQMHAENNPKTTPNVVTYGAVIDAWAKSGLPYAASRADALLAQMIHSPTVQPNTYCFNTVIHCWAKTRDRDAPQKAEEMLVSMSRLHAAGLPVAADNFTYTAVIDAWAKSGCRGAAARADQLLTKMEAKYSAGDVSLKPNSYTYNAVICALAKSGEAGAAARAERVLQNMVNRHRQGGDEDIKPTTINFNTVLDAWAKSGGGRPAAERAEEILEWMDRLHKEGSTDVRVDTISFNAVLDAWARSGDRLAPRRAEQILDHMDELYHAGNPGVKPDRYTYNTLINVWAKSGERGSAARAEHVLSVMEQRFRDGDHDFKPNTRTYTSVIDAWAKSGEQGAARRAEQILNNMISRYEAAGDPDVKPNVHTANTVCNACAFSKNPEDRKEALQIAFRVFEWLANQPDMNPDSYTYTILLSVCANLLPRHDAVSRYRHASAFFDRCREAGYVNDYVLRKLRQTVDEQEYLGMVEYRTDSSAAALPVAWTRNAKLDTRHNRGRKGHWNSRRRNT